MTTKFLTLFFTFFTFGASAQDCVSNTIKSEKSQTTTVEIVIEAPVETIWKVLTTADDYTKWNSTITSLEGNIALGEKIKLKSTLDEKRTFKLKIKTFEPNKKLVWGDSKGERTFTLEKMNDAYKFTMSETIGGFMYGMWSKYLPDFNKSFEDFAKDLKQKAES